MNRGVAHVTSHGMDTDVSILPSNLPIPTDDGACDHLPGAPLPRVLLPSTAGGTVDLSAIARTTVLYIYPISGPTNDDLPDGWDAIPGARGCTPQACAFRDHHRELESLDASVYGLSTQSTAYQMSEIARLHLPFPLLSDELLQFATALRLPHIGVKVQGRTVLKRVTLVCGAGVIRKVFYPVFPPDKNADEVIAWLKANPSRSAS
ncbi:peroxiredoxin [Pendulispora albinea]|uniref:Peroxiredoxin n=1 Tax=Pendulispora albinea TaxID=2741071 RepID=A0ABZ2M818_9BACT